MASKDRNGMIEEHDDVEHAILIRIIDGKACTCTWEMAAAYDVWQQVTEELDELAARGFYATTKTEHLIRMQTQAYADFLTASRNFLEEFDEEKRKRTDSEPNSHGNSTISDKKKLPSRSFNRFRLPKLHYWQVGRPGSGKRVSSFPSMLTSLSGADSRRKDQEGIREERSDDKANPNTFGDGKIRN